MPVGERVRTWAEGDADPHPDDALAVATCLASDDPLLRAAGHTHTADALLNDFRFAEALAAADAAMRELELEHAEQTASTPAVDAALLRCWALYVRADALDELGDFDAAAASAEASADLADAHRLEIAWARAVSKRIWIARQQGDAGGAAARLRELAARLTPRSHLLCAALGSTLAWLGRPETALTYAQRCLTLPGGHSRRARDHRDLAHALMRLGRFDEAADQLALAAGELERQPPTMAGRYMLLYARYHLALARGAFDSAAALAVLAAHGLSSHDNLRRHLGLLALARAQAASGRIDSLERTLELIDVDRLGAEHRARALRLRGLVAERHGDWKGAAAALGQAREILATRYLAIPAVLLIEAELAAPDSDVGHVTEFNRALATRDQLLMAAAKDLRGPIAVFELGAEMVADGDADNARVAVLVERGLAEMELLVSQLRDTELGTAVSAGGVSAERPLDELVQAALTRVQPIAAARGVAVTVAEADGVRIDHHANPIEAALTTVLALAVRAATRDSNVRVVVGPKTLTIELSAGADAPAGWGPVDSITSVTAGGPTSWALAAGQLAESGGRLVAEVVDSGAAGRVRVSLELAS